ncbi:hypothetical protein PR003_g14075 [Phytophthora rubi]|uniref:Uncharacterized protein n=1 Tax=Phytophthora rubi TaxID=129364 RepID=A0A6A4F0I9_9STRA|nr:hypothetical protein PR003_g14075 [Phytophthora rubi]
MTHHTTEALVLPNAEATPVAPQLLSFMMRCSCSMLSRCEVMCWTLLLKGRTHFSTPTSTGWTLLDNAIGVLMMILILSEYVIGATGMYEICYCIDHNTMGVSFFLAIVTLLCLAFGTILYGVHVIKNNEDELRDLGTKDHFDKKFHAWYGPLYDEHSFEGRFFFAPKLLLALLTGMTTGMIWIQGL